jgi:hypothetical protein
MYFTTIREEMIVSLHAVSTPGIGKQKWNQYDYGSGLVCYFIEHVRKNGLSCPDPEKKQIDLVKTAPRPPEPRNKNNYKKLFFFRVDNQNARIEYDTALPGCY